MHNPKTIGQLEKEDRIKVGAQEYEGHGFHDLERYCDGVRHMIIFDVLSCHSPVGDKGDRMRLYLNNHGYKKALEAQENGHITIISHAEVNRGELSYDSKSHIR